MSNFRYYVGIDPAFRINGFAMAIIDSKTKTVVYSQFKAGFIDFSKWAIQNQQMFDKTLICVENSNLMNRTFDMRGSKLVIARKSRDVGKNQAISQNVVDLCQSLGFSVIEMSPKGKGNKWNHSTLEQVLNDEGLKPEVNKTNQDKRDACKLALIAYKRPYLAKQSKIF